MSIPRWAKRNPLYQPTRAAVLSLSGRTRFYNPISAIKFCDTGRDQVETQIVGELQRVCTQDGLSIWHTPSDEIATTETATAEHLAFALAEFRGHPYFSDSVRVERGAVVLDIGANLGLFTRQALEAGAERVICFEPAPLTARSLAWNLRSAIADGRVSVLKKGAWDRKDTVAFAFDPEGPGNSSFLRRPNQNTAIDVHLEVEQVDAVVRDLGLPRIDFIKMDIEGAECRALLGAVDTLRKQKPNLAIAVEHTSDPLTNAIAVRELVLKLNPRYRCHPGRYFERGRQLIPEVLFFD